MKRWIGLVLLVIMTVCMFGGCGEKELTDEEYLELAKTKAEQNKKTVGLYITKDSTTHEITMDWLLYFLAYNERQGLAYYEENKEYFDSIYGEAYDFWSAESGSGSTIRENYKNMAFSSAVYTMLMYMEAVENEMELSDVRKAQVEKLTAEFLKKYTVQEQARCGMTEEIVRANYERILLADAYVSKLQEGNEVDEEAVRETVDKEDYRVYVTDYLYVSKYDYDDDFKKLELTVEESKERKDAIENALLQTKKGQTMISIRSLYSDFMTYATRDFYRTNVTYEADYVEAAMSLEPGECMLKETSTGYYVIMLKDNTQIVGYEEAVQKAMEEAEAVDISEIYKEIEKQYEVTKAEAWDAVEFGSYTIVK